MTTSRRRWVVDALAVAPDDHVLEVGCGGGSAVALICQRLATGTVLAIDRSAVMVRQARRRNSAYVDSGRAEIRHATFETADLPEGRFDKIFAVNLSAFWLGDASGHLARVRKLLAPEGSLHLFVERPTPAIATTVAERITRLLRAHGYVPRAVTVPDGRARGLVHVSGVPVPRPR